MRYALIALALVLLITYDRTLRTPTEMSERMSRDGIPVARIRQYIALESSFEKSSVTRTARACHI